MDTDSTARSHSSVLRTPALLRTGLLALLFLSVFGARSWMINKFGDSMPYWDQWGAESQLLVAEKNDTLTFAHFVAPHNEHRLLVPRLFWLAVFKLNSSQWDNLPTLYATALVTASCITLLVGVFLSLTGWRHWQIILPAAALLYGLPLAWLNMLWGFQGQFHFLLLFAVATLAGLGLARPLSAGWWLGALAAIAAIFTSGSGFLVVASALFLIAIRSIRDRSFNKKQIPTLVYSLAIIVAGTLLLTHIDGHDRLKAASIGDFLASALKNFAWPVSGTPLLALVMFLPLAILLVRYLIRATSKSPRGSELLILIGSFVACQLLAIGYSRGINGFGPHARYHDIHLLGLITNMLALTVLLADTATAKHFINRTGARLLTAVWLCLTIVSATKMVISGFGETLPNWKETATLQQDNLRLYLATNDQSHLRNKERLAIPHHSPDVLIAELDSPVVRAILPTSLRLPTGLQTTTREGTFQDGTLPKEIGPNPSPDTFFSCYTPKGGDGKLVTEVIPSSLPYLRFWHCGYQAVGKLEINLLDADGNHLNRVKFADVKLARDRRGWRPIICAAPGVPFRIEALDRRTGGWFAFTEPQPIGRLSALSTRYGNFGRSLTLLSLPLLVAIAITNSLGAWKE